MELRLEQKIILSLYAIYLGYTYDEIESSREIWKSWLKVKCRSVNELYALINDKNVSNMYKAHALVIALCPNISYVPFEWRQYDGKCEGHLLSNFQRKSLDKLADAKLFNFFIRLVPTYIGFLRKEKGVYPQEVNTAQRAYNTCLLIALKNINENSNLAQHLFDQWSLLDPEVYMDETDHSGYGAFMELLCSPIPMKWKRIAENKMREIILNEFYGSSKPRADHEDAMRQYINIVQFGTYASASEDLRDLYAKQVRFIVEKGFSRNGSYIFHYNIPKILKQISNERFLPIRIRLAEYVFSKKHPEAGKFYANEEYYMNAAISMLNDRTKTDLRYESPENSELLKKLQEVIRKGKQWMEYDEDKAKKQKIYENRIYILMRKK